MRTFKRSIAALIAAHVLAQSAGASEVAITQSRETVAGLAPGFVYLRDVDPSILQDIRYAGADNFTGKPVPGYGAAECVLTRAAAEALARIQVALRPQNLTLKVYDCYRPQRAVASFVAWAKQKDRAPPTRRFFPNLRKEQLVPLGYIAEQSSHPRGVAVDLTLVQLPAVDVPPLDPKVAYAPCTAKAAKRAPDNSVDMGTGYDCFDTQSHTASPRINKEQRAWRLRLLGAMTKEGFENFDKEWWHYVFPSPDQTVHDFEVTKHD